MMANSGNTVSSSNHTGGADGKLTGGSPRSQRAALNDADEEYESSSSSGGQNRGSASYAISNMLMSGVNVVGGQKPFMPVYIIRFNNNNHDNDDDDDPTDEDQQHLNPDVPRSEGPNTQSPLLIGNGSSSGSGMARHYTRPEVPHTNTVNNNTLLGALPTFGHTNSSSINDSGGYVDPETIIPHHEEKVVGGYQSSSIVGVGARNDMPLVADSKPRTANLSNLHAKAIRDNSSTIPTTQQSRVSNNTGTRYQHQHSHSNHKLPPQFLCELSRKVMTEPVQSLYGESCHVESSYPYYYYYYSLGLFDVILFYFKCIR